jgi:hypothetical protein
MHLEYILYPFGLLTSAPYVQGLHHSGIIDCATYTIHLILWKNMWKFFDCLHSDCMVAVVHFWL